MTDRDHGQNYKNNIEVVMRWNYPLIPITFSSFPVIFKLVSAFVVTETTNGKHNIGLCDSKWQMKRWVDAGNPTCTQMAFLYLWAISVAAAMNSLMPSA